jgi:hypothetical protein
MIHIRGFTRHIALLVAFAAMGTSCVQTTQKPATKLLSEGKTSDGTLTPLTVPNNVAPSGDSGVSKVAAGLQHACAIRSGKLTCWGLNKHGQIGNGDSGVIDGQRDPLTGSTYTVKVALTPYAVFSDSVTDIALGYEHTCAVRGDELFCWGSNEFGQLGNGTSSAIVSRPISIIASGVKQVAARGRWTCAVVNSTLQCFGTRLVKVGADLVPKRISSTPKTLIAANVKSVSMSANHACVVLLSGSLQCFGMNMSGEIGNGLSDGADVVAPYEVFSSGATSAALTDGRSVAVVDGILKAFGTSLGDREIDRTAGGWRVVNPTPYDSVFWNGVAPGLQVSASGTVLASSGDLLYGSFFHSSGTAQKVAIGVANFGYSETDLVGCMMFRNHAVKCWGPNLFGQLGMGRRSAEEFSIFKAQDAL